MAKTTVTVRGDELAIDENAIKSWRAFNLFRTIEEDESNFAKAAAVFELAQLLCGLDGAAIAERCGGDAADAGDVIGYALEIIQAAIPKN